MNPILVIIPAAALLLGPRLWVEHVRKRHSQAGAGGDITGAELARVLLDEHGLPAVAVERTDLGDHYDLRYKAVRLSRDSHDGRSLAALVTAAHEVGHALQDATGYAPFRWRAALAQVARATAEVGGIFLIAAPVTAVVTRTPLPRAVVGVTACTVLGTGAVAQLAALPTEWDASFRRALPMLEGEYLRGAQVDAAREVLLACSLTYLASSLAAILQFWPWLPRRSLLTMPLVAAPGVAPRGPSRRGISHGRSRASRGGTMRTLVRLIGKPLIRGWYQARAAVARHPTTRNLSTRRPAARPTR